LALFILLIKVEKLRFNITPNLNWKSFFKGVFIKLMLIALLTSLYVFITDKESLFNMVIGKPKLWVLILFVYSFFSVYPQELIYRTFFFEKYRELIKNKKLLIFINAIVFSFGYISLETP
jgi:hypothetical protein